MTVPNRKRVTKLTRERSKQLRREATGPERVLWSALRAGQLQGLKFRRQYPFEHFISDFYCHSARLVIELDGDSHEGRQQYDHRRQQAIEGFGLRVFRVTNDDVLTNLEGVLEAILMACRVPASDRSPPPRQGEGLGEGV